MRTVIRTGILATSLLASGVVGAADIRDIRVGGGYYLYRALENNVLVRAVEVDHRNGRVLVQYSNGAVDWVSPQALLTQSQSDQADVGTAVAGVALIACMLNPKACEEAIASSTNQPSSSSAPPPSERKNFVDLRAPKEGVFGFAVENKCNEPVRVMLHFQDAAKKWHVQGPWTVSANHNTLLLNGKNETLVSKSVDFYFYARSVEGSKVWRGDHNVRNRNGEVFPMKMMSDKEGDSDLVLTC